jgi:hypothetical protein
MLVDVSMPVSVRVVSHHWLVVAYFRLPDLAKPRRFRIALKVALRQLGPEVAAKPVSGLAAMTA